METLVKIPVSPVTCKYIGSLRARSHDQLPNNVEHGREFAPKCYKPVSGFVEFSAESTSFAVPESPTCCFPAHDLAPRSRIAYCKIDPKPRFLTPEIK